jgi:hypothetical protein
MPKIKVLRGNTSSLANYAGQSGEIALNSDTGNIYFWTNTANVFYTFAGVPSAPAGDSPFQGSTSGYILGGVTAFPLLVGSAQIMKFGFSSGSPASIIGGMPGQVVAAGGASSDTHGYIQGGYRTNPYGNYNDKIDKHVFASDTDGTQVQSIAPTPTTPAPGNHQHQTGYQSISTGYAYWNRHPGEIKMPFASDTDAVTYTADLGYAYNPSPLQIPSNTLNAGASSTQNRYKAGGYQPNVPFAGYFGIMRNPFSSDTSIIVGGLTYPGYYAGSVSGETAGYALGGAPAWSNSATNPNPALQEHDHIQKFLFSSDTDSTDVGQLGQTRQQLTGFSSTTDGYAAGGVVRPANTAKDEIYKFPFSSESTVSDQAEMAIARWSLSSTQV